MKHTLKKLVPRWVKNIYHTTLAIFASMYFGFPAKKLCVIGITGTDGKTTTTQCISAILRTAGKRVAVASTINFRIGDREWVNTSKFTTLSGWKLQAFLRQVVTEKCTHAIVEVSSHALDQGRVSGVHFDIAVITNVTREHLDYHKTMKHYRRAKRRLFERADIGIVNLDMEHPEEFLSITSKQVTYSRIDTHADVFAKRIESRRNGSDFFVNETVFHLALHGLFNVENALAAIAVVTALGTPIAVVAKGIASIQGVHGRMEHVPNDRGIDILIDYALTPHALELLYSLVASMKPNSESKIIAVFGACGDRDRGKRPIMGKIVSSYADMIILTNEDPYTEDPDSIVSEIEAGITNKIPNTTLWTIMDRRDAICKALALAVHGDIVVVSGKGAEETMAIGDMRIPWNDKKVILECLN